MRTTLHVLAACSLLACATPSLPPARSPEPTTAIVADGGVRESGGSFAKVTEPTMTVLADGGVCDPGEDFINVKPPALDQQTLRDGLKATAPGGLVEVKCTITTLGEIRDCVALKDEAGVSASVIQRLLRMQARPATCKGQPISIDYVARLLFKP